MTERLTAEREAALVAEMRAGSTRARDALIAAMEGLIRSFARDLAGIVDADDLAQEGRVALMKLLETFDPERARLAAYASSRMRGAMLNVIEAATRHADACGVYAEMQAIGDIVDEPVIVETSIPRNLTPMEAAVLGLINDGYTPKEAGRRLGISAEYARQLKRRGMAKIRKLSRLGGRPPE